MKIGVIGAGTMGQGIAKAFAQVEGNTVALCDIKQEWAEAGKAKIEKSYAKLSDNQKKAMAEAAKEVQDKLRANSKNEDIKAMEALKEKGMQCYIVPESDLQEWRDATKPVYAIFEQHAGALGKELIELCTK